MRNSRRARLLSRPQCATNAVANSSRSLCLRCKEKNSLIAKRGFSDRTTWCLPCTPHASWSSASRRNGNSGATMSLDQPAQFPLFPVTLEGPDRWQSKSPVTSEHHLPAEIENRSYDSPRPTPQTLQWIQDSSFCSKNHSLMTLSGKELGRDCKTSQPTYRRSKTLATRFPKFILPSNELLRSK